MYYYQLKHYSEFERTATLNICNFSPLKSLRSAFSNQIESGNKTHANKQQRK